MKSINTNAKYLSAKKLDKLFDDGHDITPWLDLDHPILGPGHTSKKPLGKPILIRTSIQAIYARPKKKPNGSKTSGSRVKAKSKTN